MRALIFIACALAACQGKSAPAPAAAGSGSGSGSAGGLAGITGPAGTPEPKGLPAAKADLDAAAKAMMLPPPAATVPAAQLAADHTCGPLKTTDLTAGVALLDDRVTARFLPGAKLAGGVESAKAEVTRGGVTAFLGAREMFFLADSAFPQKATKQASFGGDYDPVSIPAGGGKVQIIAGLLKAAPASPEVVALAHGWFLDGGSNVLDVAVFASGVTAENLAGCRLFAQKVLSTVGVGKRTLAYGTGAAVETKVEYATFQYKLPAGWILASSIGTHDMARLTFRKRGAYPDGFTEVQLALDSHPGDWATQGTAEGTAPGTLFGVPVTWNLTQSDYSGAWTVSKDLVKRDHAVGAIIAATPAERAAALAFAASIVAK